MSNQQKESNTMALAYPVIAAPFESVDECADQAICARHVSKQFGDEYAVRDLTFDIPAGTIFGFVGPSGSGKTTTIRLLTGTYAPTSGEVRVLGKPPSQFSRHMRERIGYMPQLFSLYPNMSVWENLNFSASLYGISLRRKQKLMELLDFVELTKDRSKLTRDLSGGMQRRLSLAATLVQDPDLIFLDEPTAGIDPVLRNKFWEHFRQLKEENRTLFITTQYVSEMQYCDRVGVMDRGRLLTVDTPDGLRYQVYGGNIIDMETPSPIDWSVRRKIEELPYVRGNVQPLGPAHLRITVDEAKSAIPDLIEFCRQQNIEVTSIQEYLPPFDDVFVHLIQREDGNHE
jgi:ABC-2 type transport system ATP-binding protein